MTEQPNPFSREGATSPPGQSVDPDPNHPDPDRSEPGGPASALAGSPWPSYPAAPDPSQYPRSNVPPSASGPYAGATGSGTAGIGAYPTSYPGQNPYEVAQPTPYAANPYATSPYATSPYGPSPYAVDPYAAASYGYTPTSHPQAVTALVLGVVGLVICSFVGIAAFIVGGRARKDIRAQPQRYSGLGMATAGWVMGIIGMVTSVLGTLFFIIGFAGGWDS